VSSDAPGRAPTRPGLVHHLPRGRVAVVLIGAVAGGLTSAAAIAGIPRSYSAVAVLAVTPKFDVTQFLATRDLGVRSDPSRYGTVGQLGEIGVTRAMLLGSVSRPAQVDLSSDPLTEQVLVTGRAQDPRAAARLTDAFLAQLVARRTAAVRTLEIQARENRTLLQRIDRGSARTRGAVALHERLKLLRSVDGVGVAPQGRARAQREPDSPHRRRDILGGAVLGALLAPWAAALARIIAPAVRRRRTAGSSAVESA